MDYTQQRQREKLASNVLLAGLAIATICTFALNPHMFQRPNSLELFALGLAFIAGFYYAIRLDIAFLRILFALGTTAFLIMSVVNYQQTLHEIGTSFWSVFIYLAFHGSRIVALVLLLPTLRPRRKQQTVE